VRLWLALFAIVIMLAGCASEAMRNIGLDKFTPRKAEQELTAGLRFYEDGNYKAASKSLQNALDAGLTFKSDRVIAHKHLAFILCTSEKEKLCRDEFKKALELDPKFELSPAEEGHPVWGPAFRGVKVEMENIKVKSK
jgi:Tfp pilus assembly protein PilF